MLTINVCVGTACHMKGAYSVINGLQSIIKEKKVGDKVIVNGAFCLGECSKPAISVRINDGEVHSVDENNLLEFFEQVVMPLL